MDSEIQLSVVVATYNRPDYLERFLNAVVHQIIPGRTLTIVNDGCHDSRYDKVVDKYNNHITYIPLPFNQGPATARNIGVDFSEGKYIVFTDDDCIPPPNWLDQISDFISIYPEFDMIGGPTKPPENKKPGIIEQFIIEHKMYPRPSRMKNSLDCFPTANVVIQRDWFEKVGGFDERFKLAGGEDLHLTQVMIKKGANIHVYNEWFTYHGISNETLLSTCKRYYRYGIGSAQHVVLSNNWNHSRVKQSKNIFNATRFIRKNYHYWRERYEPISKKKIKRFIFSILRFLVFFSHEISWWRGITFYKKQQSQKNVIIKSLPRQFACWVPINKIEIINSEISVTVIVSTYKRPDLLRKFLSFIKPQLLSNKNFSLVVSNDGSHDKKYEEVVNEFKDIFEYVVIPKNIGRGPARNIAAKRATGDYLIFTDDDCIPPINWLNRVVSVLETHPELVAVGGGTLPVRSKKPGLIEKYSLSQFLHPRPLYKNGQMWCMVTASFAVRRDWFEKLGGMNEIFKGSDDLNLTYRLRKANVPVFIDRHWITYHPQNWDFLELWERFSRYGYWVTHHAILEGDTIADADRPNDSIYDFISNIPSTIKETVKNEFRKKHGINAKICFVFISLLKHIAWHYGGIKGSRHAKKLREKILSVEKASKENRKVKKIKEQTSPFQIEPKKTLIRQDISQIFQKTDSKTSPLLVYNMSKVGSSTVYKTVKEIADPVWNVHFMNPSHLDYIEQRRKKNAPGKESPDNYILGRELGHIIKLYGDKLNYKIITIVRDPIGRAVSSIFQSPELSYSKVQVPNNQISLDLCLKSIQDEAQSSQAFTYPEKWLQLELHDFFGIDVFAYPFNKKAGYQIIRQNNVTLLVLRMEDMSTFLGKALGEMFQLEYEIPVQNANIRINTADSELYKEVNRKIRLHPEWLQGFYNSRYSRHFYTDMMIENFIKKWSA